MYIKLDLTFFFPFFILVYTPMSYRSKSKLKRVILGVLMLTIIALGVFMFSSTSVVNAIK